MTMNDDKMNKFDLEDLLLLKNCSRCEEAFPEKELEYGFCSECYVVINNMLDKIMSENKETLDELAKDD